MKTFLLPILFTFVFSFSLVAQHVTSDGMDESDGYENKLAKGIDAFYRADWEQSTSIFDELQTQAPEDSRAYFFDSMIPFWKYYFGGNSPQMAAKFMERSQKAIEISQNNLAKNPHDTTMVLMLSGLYGYQSLVAASEKQYKTAIQSGITGFKYTRQLLSVNSDDPKALIGKGMFYYMVGSVPNGLQWVTNAVGISGDTEEGLRALEQAARSESYVSNDAKMILAYLYQRENKYEKALPKLEDLTHRYPENIIFQYNLARVYEQCEYLAKARKKYQLVLGMDTVDLPLLKEESKMRLQNL